MSNYGVYVDGKRPKTKAEFKRAVAEGNHDVRFDGTSLFDSGDRSLDTLGPTDVIVGPDPYTSRKWYANVRNGKVV